MITMLSRIPFGMRLVAGLHVVAALGYLIAMILGLAGVIPLPADPFARWLGAVGPLLWLLCVACIIVRPPWGLRYCLALFACELGLAFALSDFSRFSVSHLCELGIPALCGGYIYLKRDYFALHRA